MEVTIDIPGDLYLKISALAVMREVSVSEIILEGLRSALLASSQDEIRRVRFPLIQSTRPGSMLMDAVRQAEEQDYFDVDLSRCGPA